MSFEEKIKNLIDRAKKVKLLKNEKEDGRLNLVKFMKENPIIDIPSARKASFIYFIFSSPVLKYATVSLSMLLIVCFVGAGISFGAEKSLPGDILYPIKTQVNEKVLGWLANTDDKKAKLYIDLTNKRLQEIEIASSEGKLTDKAKIQAEDLLDKSINNAQTYIKNTENKDGISADLNSSLEGSLRAHVNIIDQLSNIDNSDKLSSLKDRVTTQLEKVKKQRENSEEKALENLEKLKEDSQKRVDTVKNKIKNIKNNINNKKTNISQENLQKANEDISALEEVVLNSENYLKDENYTGAFRSLQNAIRSTEDVKTRIFANRNLRINTDISSTTTQDNSEGIRLRRDDD